MRKLALALSVAFLFVGAACNKASDKDVDEGIALWNEIWDGYFSALEANKTDIDKMVAAGQKYIDDNADKIAKINKIFNKKGTDAQINKVKKAVEDGMDKATNRLGEIGKALGAQEGMNMAKLQEFRMAIQQQMTGLVDKIMES